MEFKIEINAPREKVWDVLLGEKTYPLWTAVFAPGSSVKTDWKKGSKALFLDGNDRGMVSRVAENVPNEFLSLEHLGYYEKGVEDLEKAKAEGWAGAKENYTLNDLGGKTELVIHMEMGGDPKMIEYFEKTWPKALEKVKELAE